MYDMSGLINLVLCYQYATKLDHQHWSWWCNQKLLQLSRKKKNIFWIAGSDVFGLNHTAAAVVGLMNRILSRMCSILSQSGVVFRFFLFYFTCKNRQLGLHSRFNKLLYNRWWFSLSVRSLSMSIVTFTKSQKAIIWHDNRQTQSISSTIWDSRSKKCRSWHQKIMAHQLMIKIVISLLSSYGPMIFENKLTKYCMWRAVPQLWGYHLTRQEFKVQ